MRTRRRHVAALAVALIVATAVLGAAASLGSLTVRNLGGGGSSVLSCDADGVTVSYTVAGGLVTAVTVDGIAAGCSGGQLSLTLANAAGTSIGAGGPQAVVGSSAVVPVIPQPSASAVAAIHIAIEGP